MAMMGCSMPYLCGLPGRRRSKMASAANSVAGKATACHKGHSWRAQAIPAGSVDTTEATSITANGRTTTATVALPGDGVTNSVNTATVAR